MILLERQLDIKCKDGMLIVSVPHKDLQVKEPIGKEGYYVALYKAIQQLQDGIKMQKIFEEYRVQIHRQDGKSNTFLKALMEASNTTPESIGAQWL